jgi:hypothetical protein
MRPFCLRRQGLADRPGPCFLCIAAYIRAGKPDVVMAPAQRFGPNLWTLDEPGDVVLGNQRWEAKAQGHQQSRGTGHCISPVIGAVLKYRISALSRRA